MPYSAEISRNNPTCFLFLVDQSGSMGNPFPGQPGKRRAHGVADAINRLLYDLVMRCATGEDILDRYYIGVLGYGEEVGPALKGELTGQPLVKVSDIGKKPLKIEERRKKTDDGAGGVVETTVRFPIWLKPEATGRKTRMCEVLRQAKKTIDDFVKHRPDSYPPIVINITDGEANDGNPEADAEALRNTTTSDGNILLFNVHISSSREQAPVQFPTSEGQLSDKYARLLFRMSSQLPPKMVAEAQAMEFTVSEGARGFVYNADLVSVVQFLDIGTRTAAS